VCYLFFFFRESFHLKIKKKKNGKKNLKRKGKKEKILGGGGALWRLIEIYFFM